MQEIASQCAAAITCYRVFKQIRFWHLEYPDILHSYHLKMVFFRACHKYPLSLWTDSNFAANLLGLLDDLFYCLATKSLPSYFIPHYNLIEAIHSDFLFTLLDKLNEVKKDPVKNITDLKRWTLKWCLWVDSIGGAYFPITKKCNSQKNKTAWLKKWLEKTRSQRTNSLTFLQTRLYSLISPVT